MCIFCQIVAGEIPAYKVYEDEQVLAFLDIQPINFGHTLVIPKKHYQNIEEIPEEELAYLMKIVKRVGLMLKKNFQVEGYNLGENNDPVAGQEVPHLHFHLIPRYSTDQLCQWSKKEYKEGEMKEVLKKIINK